MIDTLKLGWSCYPKSHGSVITIPPCIIIDFDETLFGVNKAWVQKYNDTYHEGYPVKSAKRVEYWSWGPEFTGDEVKQLFALRTPDLYQLYRHLIWPEPGSVEAISLLEEVGYLVCVITRDKSPFAVVKQRLLQQHFPTLSDKLVIAKNKHEVISTESLLIDDYYGNEPNILLSKPHNRHVRHMYRMNSWKEITEYLVG